MDDDYLERTGADRMIQAMVQQLQVVRPANPAEFMVQYLQDNYVKKELPKKRSDSYESYEGSNEEDYDRPYLVVPDSFKRKRRGAICCDVPTSQGYEPQRTQFPKSAETRLCLEEALSKNIMFSHLEPEQLSQIFAVMTEVKLKPGEIVFRQGDEADKFYVLEKGECDVFAVKSGASQHVATYDEGSAFGELALVADTPRTSTVRAKTDVIAWAIDRLAFRLIVTETTKRTRIIYDTFLEKVPILAHLTKAERAIVADSLSTEQFWDGDIIVKQGDTGDKFYIIVQGSVEVSRFNEPLGRLETSHYFGEIALLTNRPRAATITAVGDTKCVCLDRGSFNRLLGPIEDILLRNMEMYNLYISTNV